MAQSEFSIHLGGGLYMDNAGVLSHGTDPGKPVYPSPGGGLPVDPKAVAAAFQGLAKALPNKDDPKSREKFDDFFDDIGMTDENKNNLIDLLQAAGGVASVIGSVVPVVGAALAVLTLLLGFLKEGPSALELMVIRWFKELATKVKALEVQSQQHFLIPQRNAISAAVDALKNYAFEIQNTPPNETQLLLRRQEVRTEVKDAGLAVRNLLDSATWLASFDASEYEAVWPWMGHRLNSFPSGGAPQLASMPPPGNRFDHRLMVPLVLFAITAYLSVLRASAPEFRSTRENREDLWTFAGALDVLITNMRRDGLTRTVYTAADFQGGPGGGIPWGLDPVEVVDLQAFGFAPRLAEGCTRFPVGAFDTCAHDDAYFTAGFSAGLIQFPGAQYAKQGVFNARWMPPATLESYEEQVTPLGNWEPANQPPPTRRRYRITNPEECAQAANAQSERDFVDLLYGSGYLNLVHLLATLRNEAADPDHSQTVRSTTWFRRRPGPLSTVVVESVPILMTGVITAQAQTQSQDFEATTSMTTQPLGRDRALHYRVWLRTLPGKQEYRNGFYWTDYEPDPDPDHAGGQRLVTSTGAPLDEVMIAQGVSRPELFHETKPVTLTASTYDLWIPVKPLGLPQLSVDPVASSAALRAAGWEVAPTGGSGGLPTRGRGQLTPVHDSAAEQLVSHTLSGWTDAEVPAKAQQRAIRESDVHLDYTVRWQADKLTVSLRNNRAEDRNYVVYVVVEETLGSGVVLHTVERMPVTGQLTFVPQSFFDEEFDALAKTARFFRDFAKRYAKSVSRVPGPGGPGDPGPDWLRGLDREVLASDPVLRELVSSPPSTTEDFTRLAGMLMRHPRAAALLREALNEADVSPAVRDSVLHAKNVGTTHR